jgi:hypothetical protein
MLLSSFLSFFPLFFFWLIIGPFYLIAIIFKDTYHFIKVLGGHKDDEIMFKEKEENDFKQDKIVIYNEVIDVMRSILHLF